MLDENINQKFRLEKKKKNRWNKKLFNWRNGNKWMSKKHKNICRGLNYIDHLLIIISTITGCVSISAFASLVGIPIRITSSAIGLEICVIAAGIKMSII